MYCINSTFAGTKPSGWQESKGALHYSPKQIGKHISPNWWVVVKCDPSIGEYYRNLYYITHNKCRNLIRPAWKEHISIVRNEEPTNKQSWELFVGCEMKFFYNPEVKNNGTFYWLDVICPGAIDVRKELGLPSNAFIPLHLTIGHTDSYDEACRTARKIGGFTLCPCCEVRYLTLVPVCRECGYEARSK